MPDVAEILKTVKSLEGKVSRDNTARYLKNHFPEAYDGIMSLTWFLDKFDSADKNKKISLFERVYCLENGLRDRPRCRRCGTEYVCGFNKQADEYRKWCSARCQASDPECQASSRQTRLERYGDENFHGVDKARATRLVRNDGKWHAPGFGDAVKRGKEKNGHAQNWVNSGKAKATKLKRYGDANWNNWGAAAKTKETRYGDANWNNRDKYSKMMFKTYGVKTPLEREDVRNRAYVTRRLDGWRRIDSDRANYEPLFTREDYVSTRSAGAAWRWRCAKCGTEFESAYVCQWHKRCPKCCPGGKSAGEIEILEYLRGTLGLDARSGVRDVVEGRELDIVVPSLKVAIEFDGLYWHSDAVRTDASYHLKKTEACEAAGYKLVHVFEDEWAYKSRIVKDHLRRALVGFRRIIPVSECEVRPIDYRLKDRFLCRHSLMGADRCSAAYGLFRWNVLIAVMTFAKAMRGGPGEWEMSRYATIAGFNLPGAGSALLGAFEHDFSPVSIKAYWDRRWPDSGIFMKMGFAFERNTRPGWFYVVGDKRESRLAKGHENRRKVYDCGYAVYRKTYGDGV